MPRQPRLCVAGMPFHVIQRGNNRSPCFGDDHDYQRYLALLGEWTRWHGVAVHAYVLMTNHVHLLATPACDDSLGRAMKMVGQLYAQHANRKYRRTGTFWEGRFHSGLVDSESYLLCCYRYIESNPVRAAMVAHPADYRWSSYRANALSQPDPLVTPHATIETLGRCPEERRTAYRELFRHALAPETLEEIRKSCRGGTYALGSASFRSDIAAQIGRPVERLRRGPKKRKLSTCP